MCWYRRDLILSPADIILSKSEYESLLEEVHRLQAKISELTALRDDLIYHVCPALQAEYEEKIGSLEREILAAEMYLRENQRILEILQAQMNQQKQPDVEEAQKQAKEEFHEYEEDLKRKAKEAQEFRDKWEKESGWSEHDRQEKEEKKKRGDQGHQREQTDAAGLDRDDDSEKPGEEDPEKGAKPDGENPEREKAGDGAGTGEGRDRDHEKFPGEEGQTPDEEAQNETPAKKLKRLYRKIVKRLHPDVHPEITLREKELFNMAQEAMKRGDLETMERIYDELAGMDAPEEKFEDTPEGIAKLKELIRKLKERLRRLQDDILHIRSEFPYTMKAFLEDEAAVEERRHELQEKLRNLREANEKLVEFIRKIREETGL